MHLSLPKTIATISLLSPLTIVDARQHFREDSSSSQDLSHSFTRSDQGQAHSFTRGDQGRAHSFTRDDQGPAHSFTISDQGPAPTFTAGGGPPTLSFQPSSLSSSLPTIEARRLFQEDLPGSQDSVPSFTSIEQGPAPTYPAGDGPPSLTFQPSSTLRPLTVKPAPTDIPGQCHDICAASQFYPVAEGYDNNRERQAELDCIVDCNPCAGACVVRNDGSGYQCLNCYALQGDGQ